MISLVLIATLVLGAPRPLVKLPFLDGLVPPDKTEVSLERNAAFLANIRTWFAGERKDEAEYRKRLGVDARDLFATPNFAQLRGASKVIAAELGRRASAGGFADWLDTALRFHQDWDRGFGMPRSMINSVMVMSGELALLKQVQEGLPRIDAAERTRVRELIGRYRSERRAGTRLVEDDTEQLPRRMAVSLDEIAAFQDPLNPIDQKLRGLVRSRRADFEKRFGTIVTTVDARLKGAMQQSDRIAAMTALLKAVRAKLEPRAKAKLSELGDDALIDAFTARIYYEAMPNYAAALEKDAAVVQLLEQLSRP